MYEYVPQFVGYVDKTHGTLHVLSPSYVCSSICRVCRHDSRHTTRTFALICMFLNLSGLWTRLTAHYLRPHMYVPQFVGFVDTTHGTLHVLSPSYVCSSILILFREYNIIPAVLNCNAVSFPSVQLYYARPTTNASSLQSIFSARRELVPILTFIHTTPKTGPLITTHTLITIPRKKILGSARPCKAQRPHRTTRQQKASQYPVDKT